MKQIPKLDLKMQLHAAECGPPRRTARRACPRERARRFAAAAGAAALLLGPGCASTHPEVRGPDAPLAAATRANLGTVALVTIPYAPPPRHDQSSGHTRYAGSGANNGLEASAQIWAATFYYGGPWAVFTLPIIPLGALAGAADAASQTLSPAELQQAEAQVRAALAAAGQPAVLERAFARAAAAHRIALTPAAPLRNAGPDPRVYEILAERGVNQVLELRLERLALERTSPSDASFALHADTRVRLIAVSGGGVLYEARFRFRSASQLFYDWSLHDGGAVRQIADSGYEMVAEEMLRQIYGVAPRNVTLYARH